MRLRSIPDRLCHPGSGSGPTAMPLLPIAMTPRVLKPPPAIVDASVIDIPASPPRTARAPVSSPQGSRLQPDTVVIGDSPESQRSIIDMDNDSFEKYLEEAVFNTVDMTAVPNPSMASSSSQQAPVPLGDLSPIPSLPYGPVSKVKPTVSKPRMPKPTASESAPYSSAPSSAHPFLTGINFPILHWSPNVQENPGPPRHLRLQTPFLMIMQPKFCD